MRPPPTIVRLLAFGVMIVGCSDAGRTSASEPAADAGSSDAVDAGQTSVDGGAADGGENAAYADRLSPWRLNTTERATYFSDPNSNEGALYDVQRVEIRTVEDAPYVYIETNGIPQYDIVATQDVIDTLNTRPRASTDFLDGATSAQVDDVIVFGQDIGYNSNTTNCESEGGYWPPGPECPVALGRAEFFAAEPTPSTEECETGLGTIGLMVNGAAVFNWGDGMAYGNGVWYNLAPFAEQYDVDICGGHAAMGEYHHHFYTTCLAELVGDDGSTHSPVYGYAADGYPLHGPYEDAGALAVSGWVTRDYGADTSQGGCGTPGERTCTLNDPYDISAGVDTNVAAGPSVGEVVTTLSQNQLPAIDGYYFEDYYFGGATAQGDQLDEHNGHDNGDGRGYHYHITLVEGADGKLTPAFPFTIGPRFRGSLPDNAAASCSSGAGGPPGPPGGGGGPPGG